MEEMVFGGEYYGGGVSFRTDPLPQAGHHQGPQPEPATQIDLKLHRPRDGQLLRLAENPLTLINIPGFRLQYPHYFHLVGRR
jgi:hypothetical protein